MLHVGRHPEGELRRAQAGEFAGQPRFGELEVRQQALALAVGERAGSSRARHGEERGKKQRAQQRHGPTMLAGRLGRQRPRDRLRAGTDGQAVGWDERAGTRSGSRN
jgi:hypothetical protein